MRMPARKLNNKEGNLDGAYDLHRAKKHSKWLARSDDVDQCQPTFSAEFAERVGGDAAGGELFMGKLLHDSQGLLHMLIWRQMIGS